MKRLNDVTLRFAMWAQNLKRNIQGQDLIEYALMAGFVAVAAGALTPNVASHQHRVFEDHLSDG